MHLSITRKIGLLIIVFLLVSLSACVVSDEQDYDLELIISSEIIAPNNTYTLSLSAVKDGNIIEQYLPELITYEIIEGQSIATLNHETGEIIISALAPYNSVIKIKAVCNGKETELKIIVSKISVVSVEISAQSTIAYVGQSVQFNGFVSPINATYSGIEYSIVSGQEYGEINSETGLLTVHMAAELDEIIEVQGFADTVSSNIVMLTIASILVDEVYVIQPEEKSTVMQGGTIAFDANVLPVNASFPTVSYAISSGEEYGSINASTGVLTINSATPVGIQVGVVAIADGVYSEPYVVTVEQLEIEGLVLSALRYNVEINGYTELSANILPFNAYGIEIFYEVVDGITNAVIDGNVVNIMPHAPSGSTVSIQAYCRDSEGEMPNSRSNIIEISVYKVQVTSVTLTTSDNTIMVAADSSISFGVNVLPLNATDKTPVYAIVSGSNFASIDSFNGVLTIMRNNEDGEVGIVAIVDGVTSNVLILSTAKFFMTIANTTYSIFDYNGAVFQGYRNVHIKLKDMPEDANLTTIVIPNTVKRLVLEGNYSSISPLTTKNLFFYFYRAQNIEITLINTGIETFAWSGGNIFDLPQNSNATFIINGECCIKSGSPINPYYYTVDGVYNLSDDKHIYRMHGMDGHNGGNGGAGISGYNLEFKGSGSLYIEGGDGAHGSAGGKGADVPAGSAPGSISGNGGKGGSGGNGGYAIYGYNITFNMSITGVVNAFSGNAGRGGNGGSRGQTIVGGSFGANGEAGINGTIVSPIAAYNNLNIINGYIYQTSGTLSSSGWTIPPSEGLYQIIARMESTYGVDMHIKDDFYSPYSQYPMTKLNDDPSIFFMLRIIDNVLSKFPTNIFREIWIMSGKRVNIYIVNTISSGSIAGLASTANNVWLAYSTPNIRNIFYSDVENFAFHELMHILHYNAASFFSENTVKSFNGGYSYVTGTPTSGIYNLENGFHKMNSYFLTSYSRRNWQEDVCETFSMIARQSRYWDFLDSDAPIRAKFAYITSAIDNGYETCGFYKTEYWERFL